MVIKCAYGLGFLVLILAFTVSLKMYNFRGVPIQIQLVMAFPNIQTPVLRSISMYQYAMACNGTDRTICLSKSKDRNSDRHKHPAYSSLRAMEEA
jgi:hypothetical protein